MGVGFGRGHATRGAGRGRSWLGNAVGVSVLCLCSIVHSSFPRPRRLGLPSRRPCCFLSASDVPAVVVTNKEARPAAHAEGSAQKLAIDMPEWRRPRHGGKGQVGSPAQRRVSNPVVSSPRRSASWKFYSAALGELPPSRPSAGLLAQTGRA